MTKVFFWEIVNDVTQSCDSWIKGITKKYILQDKEEVICVTSLKNDPLNVYLLRQNIGDPVLKVLGILSLEVVGEPRTNHWLKQNIF